MAARWRAAVHTAVLARRLVDDEQSRSSGQCSICTQRNRVWCCECQAVLCLECCARLHPPPGEEAVGDEERDRHDHSIEDIIDFGGHAFLTPLVDECLLVLCIYKLLPGFTITEHYEYADMCPTVNYLRSSLAGFDRALYTFTKGYFANWCDSEDTFWNLCSDIWVRHVVTNTDSYELLISQVPGVVSSLVYIWVFAQPIAVVYAIITWALRMIELTFEGMKRPAAWVEKINWCTSSMHRIPTQVLIRLGMRRLLPARGVHVTSVSPKTALRSNQDRERGVPRTCPSMLAYWVSRLLGLRHFQHYYRKAFHRITSFAVAFVVSMFCTRFVLILSDGALVPRSYILMVPMIKEVLQRHQGWFQHLKKGATDKVLLSILSRGVGLVDQHLLLILGFLTAFLAILLWFRVLRFRVV